MKKYGTAIGIFLSAAGILLLLGLGVYLALDQSGVLTGAQSPENAASRAGDSDLLSQAEEAVSTQSSPADEPDEQTAATLAALRAANKELPEHHIIFVGDSRTVGMGEAEAQTGDACTYIGAVGEGFQWFLDSGMTQMENAMKEDPQAPVVLNLGINDMDNLDLYLELYGSFSETYPETDFYFLSVNPVTEEASHVTNGEIASFNSALRAAFPETYLDCSTYLRIREFETVDGVHYSQDTYQVIHDFTVQQICS